LPLHQLCDPQQHSASLLFQARVISRWRDEFGHLLFFQLHIVLLSNFKGFGDLAKPNHYFNCFFVLLVLH
jgi:hypothetical protein